MTEKRRMPWMFTSLLLDQWEPLTWWYWCFLRTGFFSSHTLSQSEHAVFLDVNRPCNYHTLGIITVKTSRKAAVRHSGQLSSWRGDEATVLADITVICSSCLKHQEAGAVSHLALPASHLISIFHHIPTSWPYWHYIASSAASFVFCRNVCYGRSRWLEPVSGTLIITRLSLALCAPCLLIWISPLDYQTSLDSQILTMESRSAFCRRVSSSAEKITYTWTIHLLLLVRV